MDNHTYIFIIWDESRHKTDLILDDIKSKFTIREVFEITWTEKNFQNNLIRFYGHSLPNPKKKKLLCGTGPFLLIIVNDDSPSLRNESSFTGSVTINENIVASKMMYREWVGQDFSVHGSISTKETNHNLTLLLHKPLGELEQNLPKVWDGKIKTLTSDLIGSCGWHSFQEFLNMLNGTVNYVILRNFEDFSNSLTSNLHNDVDILTDGDLMLPYVCMIEGAEPPKGIMPKIIVDQKILPIDWKRPCDNFYDKRWYHDILNRRILHKNGFYIPSDEDYLYTLFYHMIFHKQKISEEYRKKILTISNNLGKHEINENLLDDFEKSKKFLESYLKKMKYSHPTSLNYKLKNGEFSRLAKLSIYLLKTEGITFFMNEFKAKISRSLS